MKSVITATALLFAVCAWPDGQPVTTFTGKGKSGIEVRDASGNVEVVNPSTLRLNQIPADAAAREKVYREKVEAEATALAERRAEEAAAAEVATKEAADAKEAEEAAKIVAAEEAELEHEEHYPRKVRRNTVRGTRYIEDPPPPPPPAPSTEPVLSISGKKKAAVSTDAADAASDAAKPAPESQTPAPAPEPEGF